jgi:hypothetical protein
MAASSLPKPLSDKHKCVIYLRVSTEEQVDNYSLDTQSDICRKEAERRGLTIVDTFREEGRSAKTIKERPTLIDMLDYCRKNKREVGAVIVYRLDPYLPSDRRLPSYTQEAGRMRYYTHICQ